MSHFNSSFLTFFRELATNNNSEWFNQNRKTYEKEVKKPFSDFVEEMIRRIQEQEPDLQLKPSDAIARINKDIRFSKDKTPYNTHVSANISVYGKKDKSYPGFFFRLSPENIEIYGGVYAAENHVIQAIRTFILANISDFKKAYGDPLFIEKYGAIQGEKSKRIPPEFKEAVLQEPLIGNKQFYFSATLPATLISSPQLADQLMEYYMAAKKVSNFLRLARTDLK
ncbi:MAG: DUF2461 domain-containing protein [Fluviicola sp.]|nr:DUF2461 domain-containing protein [Fluviicola sp.]